MILQNAPVTGSIGPRPDGLDLPYWSGLSEGRLVVQRCDACAAWIWGPMWICPHCRHDQLTWTEVDPSGRIYTWTRTYQPFSPEFADTVPYLAVLVELPHAGSIRLLGILLGDQERDPQIGEAVTGVFQRPDSAHEPIAEPDAETPTVLRWTRTTTR